MILIRKFILFIFFRSPLLGRITLKEAILGVVVTLYVLLDVALEIYYETTDSEAIKDQIADWSDKLIVT